jgi:hypothetical protein
MNLSLKMAFLMAKTSVLGLRNARWEEPTDTIFRGVFENQGPGLVNLEEYKNN